jgi:hypothetical protein
MEVEKFLSALSSGTLQFQQVPVGGITESTIVSARNFLGTNRFFRPDTTDFLKDAFQHHDVLGLKWRECTTDPIANRRILKNEVLANALKVQTSFSLQEWESFGIGDLRHGDVVETDTARFEPVGQCEWPAEKMLSQMSAAKRQKVVTSTRLAEDDNSVGDVKKQT